MLMSVALFCFESNIVNRSTVRDAGLLITVLLGIYLGWQRRSGAVFFAPIVSWFFAWPPLWLATIIHEGFIKGLFKGFFLVTFGWALIGGAEFVVLFLTSSAVRLLRSMRNTSGPDVVVFGPEDHQ